MSTRRGPVRLALTRAEADILYEIARSVVDESALDELFEPTPGCCDDCDEILAEHFAEWERQVTP